jgi:imidazolonepropionase-like amidohydrolase
MKKVLGLCGFAAAAVIALSVTGRAQVPATGTIAFTNARIIDGTGRAPIEQGTIVVKDGRIDAVGASVKPPKDAMVVNLAGKTVMPGMVNAHGHVNINTNVTDQSKPDQLAQRLKMYASYGVTSVMSLGSDTYDEAEGFQLRDEQRMGKGPAATDAARFYSAGRPILYRPDPNAGGPKPGTETEADARADVDRHLPFHPDFVKLHIDHIPTDLKPNVRGALIDEAHKNGVKVAVHLYYLEEAKDVVARGADVIAHSVRDQDVDAGLIAAMKQHNVGYIPTLTRDLAVFVYESTPDFFKDPFFLRGMSLYKREVDVVSDPAYQEKSRTDPAIQGIKKALAQAERNLKILSDAGIPIGMGTDTGAAPNRNPGRWQGYFEHVELELMVKSGLTPMQAIHDATGSAAKIMGMKGVGTIEKGNWADLLVLNANPLTDIRNTRQIDSVYVAGRKVNSQASVSSH